jgi:hypothetical protein
MVYVDEIRDYRDWETLPKHLRRLWSHMVADSLEELHAMADAIGMRRSWFQDKPGFPHYDITPPKRAMAIRKGALERTTCDLVTICRAVYKKEP